MPRLFPLARMLALCVITVQLLTGCASTQPTSQSSTTSAWRVNCDMDSLSGHLWDEDTKVNKGVKVLLTPFSAVLDIGFFMLQAHPGS